MTKLETKIKNPKPVSSKKGKNGAYLAKFSREDDRILLYKDNFLVVVLETKPWNSILNAQLDQTSSNYKNLKKIKKMMIEVELE